MLSPIPDESSQYLDSLYPIHRSIYLLYQSNSRLFLCFQILSVCHRNYISGNPQGLFCIHYILSGLYILTNCVENGRFAQIMSHI